MKWNLDRKWDLAVLFGLIFALVCLFGFFGDRLGIENGILQLAVGNQAGYALIALAIVVHGIMGRTEK